MSRPANQTGVGGSEQARAYIVVCSGIVDQGPKDLSGRPQLPCPSSFHPNVRTLPVCNVRGTSEPEMKNYGLATLAPLHIAHPSPHTEATSATGDWERGTKAIATANLQTELLELDPKNLAK